MNSFQYIWNEFIVSQNEFIPYQDGGLLDYLIGAKHFHKEAINTKKMSGV